MVKVWIACTQQMARWFWRREKRFPSRLWFCCILLLVCICTGCDATAQVGNNASATVIAPSTDTGKPTPTTRPTAPPSPYPASPGPTILSGKATAFVAKFGQPNDHSNASLRSLHFQRYGGSTIDFLIIGLDVADGPLYAQRVDSIIAQSPPDQNWDRGAVEAICNSFAPPDATYIKDIPVFTGGNLVGIDKVYFSRSLAKALPPQDFMDAQENPVKPGFFDILYPTPDNTGITTIDSCSLVVGESQTN